MLPSLAFPTRWEIGELLRCTAGGNPTARTHNVGESWAGLGSLNVHGLPSSTSLLGPTEAMASADIRPRMGTCTVLPPHTTAAVMPPVTVENTAVQVSPK